MASKTKAQKTKLQLATKRAAIYIRVSSERQADIDKISPQAQEVDCRAYCETRGYRVVEVFRDTEKYRIGRRMVEPSGTRADRPQLQQMLTAARAGYFDVLVAWREDRLYRSYRPMLEVMECIEQTSIDIELVKETFDRKIAPVKAWAARMELDAKHDRLMMGVAGRFAKGKVWNTIPPYGYRRTGDYLELDPVESLWTRKIWEWYAEGLGVREIRRRLIAGGAPQKAQGSKIKVPWNPNVIYKILRREFYHSGSLRVTWDGQTFEIPVPSIVDPETAKKVIKRFANYKVYPAKNVKHEYLAMGLLYCGVCNVKMTSQTRLRRRGKEFKTPRSEYRCERWHLGHPEPNCAHRMNTKKLDTQVWAKVWALFEDPEEFERRIQEKIAILQATEEDAKVTCEKLERQQEDLLLERQKVITQWRKGKMTDKDYDLQIASLTIEETELERELNEKRLLLGNKAERLIEVARLYREKVVEGAEGLNDKPANPEQARLQYQTRRKFVERLVTRVELQADKKVKVYTEINLGEEMEDADSAQISQHPTRRRYHPAHTGSARFPGRSRPERKPAPDRLQQDRAPGPDRLAE